MKRELANLIRTLIDEALPPIVRERFPFAWAARLWLGPKFQPDFKQRAYAMSDRDYIKAYDTVSGVYGSRDADTTPKQMQWIVDHIDASDKVLEIGPGNGRLTKLLRGSGRDVTTLQFHPGDGSGKAVVGMAEQIPLRDKSFDVTVVSMVLEHVRRLTTTFLELQRVTRKRVLIVTPRQRFYRITFDYHLQFFYSLEHLASHVPGGTTGGKIIDSDLCLAWDV
jgi:ubiquinone/menaquinone biosynthesis C-methylase UbiE